MTDDEVLYEKKGHIAYVTLNRPSKLNALSPKMMFELLPRIWSDVREDKNVWVSIFTGAGRGFCSGADMELMAQLSAGEGPEQLGIHDRIEKLRMSGRQNGVWKPIICAVNGVCAGGGIEFVVDSDIVICSENATFLLPHTSVGQAAGVQCVQLSRRMPFESALRMMLMGIHERMTAERALQIGFVSEVVPSERLLPRATEIAETICLNAPIAISKSLEAAWRGFELPYQQALEMAFSFVKENWFTKDYLEGPRAFVEKRRPVWKAQPSTSEASGGSLGV